MSENLLEKIVGEDVLYAVRMRGFSPSMQKWRIDFCKAVWISHEIAKANISIACRVKYKDNPVETRHKDISLNDPNMIEEVQETIIELLKIVNTEKTFINCDHEYPEDGQFKDKEIINIKGQ